MKIFAVRHYLMGAVDRFVCADSFQQAKEECDASKITDEQILDCLQWDGVEDGTSDYDEEQLALDFAEQCRLEREGE